MNRRATVIIVAFISALASVIAIPLAVNIGTSNAATNITGLLSLVIGGLGLLISVSGYLFNYRNAESLDPSEDKAQTAIRLMQTIGAIERSSYELLQERQEDPTQKTRLLPLRQIREQLLRIEVWSGEDVDGFDDLIRARNSVAHGDLDSLDINELRRALAKAEQLKQKMPSSSSADDQA